jgi:membrane protein implicated in regulation of membrane protease activity
MKAMGPIVLVLTLLATPAYAYIGPGAGITVLGALWGVVGALVFAVAAVLLWPLRALFRRRRRAPHPADSAASIDSGRDAPSSVP